ncbi:hypothetical protein GA0004736_1266 [Curtobacterium sp. 9128]|uniref:hypothetical protein n=1 Tax=Curtobacterium sp. 9128 TaxID=1793722 RepID=UPI0007D721D5|nr:hypothetical protein [Curtobacterium sp. 9128]SBN62365.1 hypothetical protein GA0004736_1266 [Curtobacterium sp. 9128]
MTDHRPPFRFRTPPGWPTPSTEWVAAHQLAEPGPGFSPGPGIPPAPSGWRFWRADRRAFRAAMPTRRRRIELLGVAGLVLLVLGIVGVVVLTAADVPAVFAVAPIAAGGALYVVSCVRWWDLATDTARSIAATAGVWGSTSVSAPAARAGFGRSARVATGITAAIAAAALVVGASAGVAPVVTDAGQSLAGVVGSARGDLPEDEELAAPYTSDDGQIDITQVSDDAWDATCAATPGDSNCWSWEVDALTDCDLSVTIGFADTALGDDTRTVTRAVHVSAGRPLYIAELGDEDYSGIDTASCLGDVPHRVDVDQTPADDFAYEEQPDGCDLTGCIGWTLRPGEDCADASVQFLVTDEWRDVPDPHDLVIGAPLQSSVPVTVFAGGVESFAGDATITQITCSSSDAPDADAQPGAAART